MPPQDIAINGTYHSFVYRITSHIDHWLCIKIRTFWLCTMVILYQKSSKNCSIFGLFFAKTDHSGISWHSNWEWRFICTDTEFPKSHNSNLRLLKGTIVVQRIVSCLLELRVVCFILAIVKALVLYIDSMAIFSNFSKRSKWSTFLPRHAMWTA